MNNTALKNELGYKIKLLRITNQIHTAEDLNEIFLRLQGQILELFDADRITIYAVDSQRGELFSKFKVGDEIKEFRVKIDKKSIAGFAAFTKAYINVADVYDKDELKKLDPELSFNQTYDIQSGYRTKQVLASAILFQKELLGVVQLINKKSGGKFGLLEISSIKEIAGTLAIGFRNQVFRQRKLLKKFNSLILKKLITEQELRNIIDKTRGSMDEIISILRKEYGIEKMDILNSLSNFYYCPFMDYDPKIIIDKTLFKGLVPNDLIEKLWSPLRKIDGKIEVLIDDPSNIQKVNDIKTCLGTTGIRLVGALPGDIIRYLQGIPVDGVRDAFRF